VRSLHPRSRYSIPHSTPPLSIANSKEKIKEFEKMGSNERAAFIEKGGWDKMPGQEQAAFGVSRACATALEAPAGK
jgi:hypothetical protein